jgi:3-carboxy-cis,cis-muconate cycloisomerase
LARAARQDSRPQHWNTIPVIGTTSIESAAGGGFGDRLGPELSFRSPLLSRPVTTLDCAVLGDLFGSEEVRRVFDSFALVQAWLDVEKALARAEAEVGVVPVAAADRIEQEARAELYDLDELRTRVAETQHPLVPLVRALAERCGDDGGYVHWGATTQDVLDTALVLQVRAALEPIRRDLRRSKIAASALALEHRSLPMAGRTHGQHAVPITFGLKAASWADELMRCEQRLDAAAAEVATAQLGGAAGTLASLGDDAAPVRAAFCRLLGLAETDVPWHAARDRVRDLGHALAELGAAGERIAAEVIRLQATETAELAEPFGDASVGSSTMPQKRNPMTSEYLVATARVLRGAVSVLLAGPAHAGERDMGAWAAEWIAVPQALILGGGVVEKLAGIMEGLVVDGDRMRSNLGLTHGAILSEAAMMELARSLGHERAHALVTAVNRGVGVDGRTLAAALVEDDEVSTHLSPKAVERLADPSAYLGLASATAGAVAARAGVSAGVAS